MSKYIIKFRPVETYFFGGETTFGDDREEQNYFVSSNYYPQQTTLLGMLRFELLKYHKLLPLHKHKTEAKIRIGENSFSINSKKKSFDNIKFGDIKNISPLFMTNNNKHYYFGNEHADLQLEYEQGKSNTGTKTDKIPFLPKYDAKKYYPDILISNEKDIKKYNDIFIKQIQVGISKPERNNDETEENAFYRQTLYRLENNWEFAFVAELQNTDFGLENNRDKYSNIIAMGGEHSQFYMTIKKIDKSYNNIFGINAIENSQKAILMSDANVENSVYKHCNFAITQTQNFRFLTFNNDSYARIPTKSVKYNLLKRGSVFFVNNKTEFEKHFNNNNLTNIGLNIYKFI